jgi:DNA-binding GntR family transcriptional regulator
MEHHTTLMEAALDRDIERARVLMTEPIGYTLQVYIRSEDEAG